MPIAPTKQIYTYTLRIKNQDFTFSMPADNELQALEVLKTNIEELLVELNTEIKNHAK